MDDRYRELQRRASLGDEEAQERLAHLGCRLDQHLLQEDQIIKATSWKNADEDVGCCQCGVELYESRDLCRMGYHHLYYNPWSTELAYRCVRTAINIVEYHQLQREINDQWQIIASISPFDDERRMAALEHQQDLEQKLALYQVHPYKYLGCQFRIEADEACSRGLHFLQISSEGRSCRNLNCSYSEAEVCLHNTGSSFPRRDADGRETVRCNRCQMQFADEAICSVFGHKPDKVSKNPCLRVKCSQHISGSNLFEALVAAYQAGFPLRAVCQRGGVTIAEARGWSEKLRAFGVKKPKAPMPCRIRVRFSDHNNGLLSKDEDYTQIKESQKTYWAGYWYPLLDNSNKFSQVDLPSRITIS